MREGVHFFGGGQFVLCPFSHLEMQHFKISKNLACGTLIFNFNIFRFKTNAGLQVDIHFNNESKEGEVPFHPSVGTQNQPNPRNCFLLYPFDGITRPSKPSSQQSILCEYKQTWQLLVKIKSDPV